MNHPQYSGPRSTSPEPVDAADRIDTPSPDDLAVQSAEDLRQLVSALRAERNELLAQCRELRASEQHFRFLMQNSSDSLVILNADGSQRYVSPGAERITGFPTVELEGKRLNTLIHPEDLDRVLAAWDEAVEHPEKTVTVQYRHIHKNRGWVYSEARAQSFLHEPSVNGVIASVRDVSSRVLMEEVLQQHERALKAILDATTETISLIDKNGIILIANEAMAKRLHVSARDIIGCNAFDILPPDVAQRRKVWLQKVITSSQPVSFIDQRDSCTYESHFYPVLDPNGRVSHVAVFAKDITERMQAEEELRDSQTLLNATQSLAHIGGWASDTHNQSMTWTAETYRIHGLPPEDKPSLSAELIERSLDCYLPEDQTIIAKAFQRCAESGEGYDLRFRFVTVDKRHLWIRTMAEPVWKDGRIALVRGNIMDITEQVNHEERLRLFQDIVSSTTDAIAYIDDNYRYVLVNKAHERFSGVKQEQLIGQTLSENLGEQVFLETVKPLFDRCLQGEAINYQQWIDLPPLGRIYVDVSFFPCCDHTGRITGVITNSRDITGRKQTEEALRASEERFQAIVEASPLAMLIVREGRYRYANPFARHMLGWAADIDPATIPIEQTIDPRYLDRMYARMAACANGQANSPMELMLIHPDGRRVMTESISIPITLPEGPAILVMGVDITARKRSEELLRARLRISEAAAEGNTDDLLQCILDEVEILTESRIGFFHFLDEDQETLSLQAWSTSTLEHYCQAEGKGLHYPVSQAGVWIDCVRERCPVIHNDYASLPHRKGMPAGHAEVRRELLVPIFRGEKIVAVFGVGNKEQEYNQDDIQMVTNLGDMAWDIVLRKRAEEDLRFSEERFRKTFEHSPVGTLMVSPTFKFLQANESFCLLTGYTQEELRTLTFADITHPDHRQQNVEQIARLLSGDIQQYDTEKRYIRKDGEVIWARVSVTLVRDLDSTPLFFLPIIQDITARKKAELALLESESRYQRIVDTAQEGIWSMDSQRQTTYVNNHMAAMLGYTPEEMVGRPVEDFMFKEDLAGHFQRMQIRQQGQGGHYEHRFRHKDGPEIWTVVSATPLKDTNGQFAGSFAMFTNITHRKAAEMSLREQAVFTRRILDSTDAHIAIVNEQGLIIDTNNSWTRFGLENDGEVSSFGIGTSYFCDWSPEYGDVTAAAEAFAGICRVQLGEINAFEITYPCNSPGEQRWFTMRVLPLSGAPGNVLISHTNVTPLKLTEELLTTALLEKEVLLREVHHRVKNNLAAIGSLLAMQQRLLNDAAGRNMLSELGDRIRSMSLIHEKLYRAENLARIDFQDYIKALVSHLRTSLDSPGIHIQADARGVEMPLDFAVPCGMIINELITNALKYAFPGGHPAPGQDTCLIRVEMGQEGGRYTLTVTDNGVGLPPGFDWSKTKTLGMVLVRMLGRHQLGGNYIFDQQKGLRVTLTFNEKRGKQ